MTRRSIAGIFQGLLLLGGLIWWFPREPVVPPPVIPPAKKTAVRKTSASPVIPAPAPASALPEFGTPAFQKLVLERGAAWLASRNRDATSLLAMYSLSGDEALLQEAAGRFPENPQVCLAMLNSMIQQEGRAAEQRLWTDRLIAAVPDNPIGYYHLALLGAGEGDAAAVTAAVEAALGMNGRLDSYLREQMVAVKEGLLASGASLHEVNTLALVAPLIGNGGGLMGAGTGPFSQFFKQELEQLKESGRDEERQNLAALGLRMAEQFHLSESPNLITELISMGQKMKFLKELDPATVIANTGRTVAEEIQAMAPQKENLKALVQTGEQLQSYLESAPMEVQSKYTDRVMMDGEMAALKYLQTEMARPKP